MILLANLNNIYIYIGMQYNNKSVELFREGWGARRDNIAQSIPNECAETFYPLRECLGQHTLAIHIDKSDCDLTQWKANCSGRWRRFFIEQTYRQQVNTIMYPQAQLDAYAAMKNNIDAVGMI